MKAAQSIEQTPITLIWRALGGGEIRRGRGQAFWRNGDGWSISLNDDPGMWFDHRDGIGGGKLDLIQHVRGGSRGEAVRWLAHRLGLPLDDSPLSPVERRRYAQQRCAAITTGAEVEYWRDALIPELNAQKIAAVEAGDDEALRRAASFCNLLENGSPTDLVRAFIRHRANDPDGAALLIAAGRERDIESRLLTAQVVLLLARADEEGLRSAA